MGGSTAPLLSCLGLASGHAEAKEKLDIEILRRASRHDVYNETNTEMHHFHKSFKWIDTNYLKPLFGGQLDVIAETSMARSSGLLDKVRRDCLSTFSAHLCEHVTVWECASVRV